MFGGISEMQVKAGRPLAWRVGLIVIVSVTIAGLAAFAPPRSTVKPSGGAGLPASGELVLASGPSTQCVFWPNVTDCASTDATVELQWTNFGDTSGCVFSYTLDWGDKTVVNGTMDGGPSGSAVFASHKYDSAGTYSISISGSVESGSCQFIPAAAQFTYRGPCPQQGHTTRVTLPKIGAKIHDTIKPFTISYEALPLTFTSLTPGSNGLCTVRSNEGALPLDLDSIHVASSATTATVDFLPANAADTQVPTCSFRGLQGLANVNSTPSASAVAKANHCLLTSSAHSPTDVIARWKSPGFSVSVLGAHVSTTEPLTYYVDLGALGSPLSSAHSFQDTLQALETYVHTRLIDNLPMIDKMAAWVDPPADLSVTDPQGQVVGLVRGGKVKTFPRGGYATVGKDSIAWIIEPTAGSYHVTASGPAGEHFTTIFTALQFVGHGSDPLAGTTAWKGMLGSHGTSASKFGVRGSSLEPVITPHESASRTRPRAKIYFNLKGSSIPFAPATIIWSFGDGRKAKGTPVSHKYAKRGRYTPSVTITNHLGITVTVKLPPITVSR